MNRNKHLCSALIAALVFTFFFSSRQLYAQRISTAGKEFWVAFMDNYGNGGGGTPPLLMVQISSHVSTSGTISMPANPLYAPTPFVVSPGSTFVAYFDPVITMPTSSEVPEAMGIKIEAEDSIYVFAGNVIVATTDASLILPVQSLGSEYLVTAFETFQSEMLVAATSDNTVVEIIPSTITEGGNEDKIPFQVTLNAGETYQVKAEGGYSNPANDADFTGTYVRSLDPCKPIAVYGGNWCANVPLGVTACDHLYEQMFPLKTWGKNFVTTPLKTRLGDLFRIMASEDNTTVTIKNKTTKTVKLKKRGNFDERSITGPSIISADKPVSVAMYSKGTSADGQQGDPFMLMLLPVEQNIDNITFSTIVGNNKDHYVNIVIPSKYASTVELNGASYASSFKPHPEDASYSYAQITLGLNVNVAADYTITADTGFNAFAYGFGFADSYGFATGGHLDNLAFDFTFQDSLCAGTEFQFIDSIQFAPSEVLWDFGDGSTSAARDPKHAYASPGKYKVKLNIKESPCLPFREISKMVTVMMAPDAPAVTGNTPVCANDSVTLRASSTSSPVSYEWYDAPGGRKLSDSAVYSTPPLTTTTTYYVLLKKDKCISDLLPVTVTVTPSPSSADLNASKDTIRIGESVSIEVTNIQGGTGNYTYTWTPDIGVGAGPHSVSPAAQTTYTVVIADATNPECRLEDSLSIFVKAGSFNIPTAFSPNSDTYNDTFMPQGSGFSGYEMSIFDRWGQKIYHTNDLNAPWNGKWENTGERMPQGVYIYIITAIDFEGKTGQYIGTISLTE